MSVGAAGHRVTVRCPAKVNLGLEVLHRGDDGYHELCTLLQAIDLYDDLSLEVVEGDGSEVPELVLEGPFAAEVPPTGNTLLAAWAVLGGSALFPKLKVTLVKRIPSGAGLGGGSSDGAGMLLALRELARLITAAGSTTLSGTGAAPVDLQASGSEPQPAHAVRAVKNSEGSSDPITGDGARATGVNEAGLDPDQQLTGLTRVADLALSDMSALALRIGSDVPFFLRGGTQLAAGRGEVLTPVARRLDFHLVVGVPRFGSATGPAYAALQRGTAAIAPMVTPWLADAVARGEIGAATSSMVNDFAPYLRNRHPEYSAWFAALEDAGAAAVALTGSGSGFCGLYTAVDSAAAGLAALQAHSGLRYAGVHRPTDL